jgi:glycosyltransferase involved in cell wall biosynthesis
LATVTIGLICYNAVGTIERAVASALAQTCHVTEILIIDDGSSDGSQALVERLAALHPAIRLVTRSGNGGAGAARNTVIAEARGEIIAFFDDDDVSDPRRVELQLRRLLDYERDYAKGAPVVCHTARLQQYPDGTRRIEPTMGTDEGRAPTGFAVARRILAGTPARGAYGSCATCSQLVRAETLRALGGFDPDFRRSQDTELCIRLARVGAHFVGIANPLVTQSMTKTADKNIERERKFWLALVDKHRDVFRSAAEYDVCRRWIDVRHDWLARRHDAFVAGLLRLAVTRPAFTAMRLVMSLRNLGTNFAFSRFHLGN